MRSPPVADFFSIGTNDLTSQVLGIDRADPRMRPALAADPRVLALISRVVGRPPTRPGYRFPSAVTPAADPDVLPLLIGLGVRTLSVGAARLPDVAGRIAGADAAECAAVAAARPAGGERGAGMGQRAGTMISAQRGQHRAAAACPQIPGDAAGRLLNRPDQLIPRVARPAAGPPRRPRRSHRPPTRPGPGSARRSPRRRRWPPGPRPRSPACGPGPGPG